MLSQYGMNIPSITNLYISVQRQALFWIIKGYIGRARDAIGLSIGATETPKRHAKYFSAIEAQRWLLDNGGMLPDDLK